MMFGYVNISLMPCDVLRYSFTSRTSNQTCLIMMVFLYLRRCVFMLVTNGGGRIMRLMVVDGTLCMNCVECCIESM